MYVPEPGVRSLSIGRTVFFYDLLSGYIGRLGCVLIPLLQNSLLDVSVAPRGVHSVARCC